MLILTRRTDESVMVGDNIKIVVLGVDRNQVRIGIEAPKSIAIYREELYERIHRAVERLTEHGEVNGNVISQE